MADKFLLNNLKTIILVSILRDKIREYTLALIKNMSLIKKLVDKSFYPLPNDKSFIKI